MTAKPAVRRLSKAALGHRLRPSPTRVFSVALSLMMVGTSSIGAGEAESEVTRQVLDAIDSRAGSYTARDKRTADRLNCAGDAAYRRGDYRRARRAYWNSYPNYPNMHAYILAGDSYWREALQHAQQRASKSQSPPPACPLDNEYFARQLALDVERHLAMGLAMARRENRERPCARRLFRP